MINVFDNPLKYLDEISENIQFKSIDYHTGKSMAVVFFTKICKAGCPFCFFRSDSNESVEIIEEQELSRKGFNNLMSFINSSNISILQISGGGEPFEKPEYILETIEKANVDKIVIVTSGYWANNYEKAEKFINEMNSKLIGRNDDLSIILRVSVDKFHVSRIGDDKVKNIIQVFENNILNNPKFSLHIHTIENDNAVNNIINDIDGRINLQNSAKMNFSKSDNRYAFTTEKGLEIPVETAKLFLSNLKVNIKDLEKKQKAFDVFYKDLNESQNGNFSLYIDENGKNGLDYLISYNGNVTTWGNYQRYNSPNLYIHSAQQIRELLYKDVVSYSFLKESFGYRNSIVREVNPKAADRSILINIRDYSGTYMLEENNTRLYYAINMIKNYTSKGVIDRGSMKKLSPELIEVIESEKNHIIEMYKKSNYSIFEQIKEHEFSKELWQDMFELIKMGHYDVSLDQIQDAEKYYYEITGENIKVRSEMINSDQQRRLLEKVSPMCKKAREYILSQGKGTKLNVKNKK